MKQFGVCLMLFCLVGCPYVLHNVHNATIPQQAGHALSANEVKAAIMRSHGDPKVRYLMRDVEPGLIRCELHYKVAHKAWVDIPYSTEGYSILYQKSENLRYQAPSKEEEREEDEEEINPGGALKLETISGHYNNWIRALDLSIQEELQKSLSADTEQTDPEKRLLELQRLRDGNLINEEEFQRQRSRILNVL